MSPSASRSLPRRELGCPGAALFQLEELVRKSGGELRVVIFPFLHCFGGGGGYPFGAIHRKLVDFWRGLDVPTLDLLEVYSDYPSDKLVVNPYDAHPNVFAHQLAADAIGPFLAESATNADAARAGESLRELRNGGPPGAREQSEGRD